MGDVLQPVDPVEVLVGYLGTVLPGVHVAGSLPGPGREYVPPGRAVVVRSTGGVPVSPKVDRWQLTVTAWGESPGDEVEASRLGRRVLVMVRAAERLGRVGATPCSNVSVYSLPYDDPDPTTGRARSSATYAFDLSGS